METLVLHKWGIIGHQSLLLCACVYFVFVNNQGHDEVDTKLRKLFLRYKIPDTWPNYSAGKEEPFTILG